MDSKIVFKLIIGAVIVVILLRMMSCRAAGGPGRELYASYTEDEEPFADYDPMEMADSEEGFLPGSNKTTAPPSTSQPSASGSMPPLATSVDLLPKPVAGTTDFGEFAPKNLTQNFVDATKFIGVDTQGSSLKNANYQLRPDPPIPRKESGPFLQSTIEADLYRKNVFC